MRRHNLYSKSKCGLCWSLYGNGCLATLRTGLRLTLKRNIHLLRRNALNFALVLLRLLMLELAIRTLDNSITQHAKMIDAWWKQTEIALMLQRPLVLSSVSHTAKPYVTLFTVVGLAVHSIWFR